MASIPIAAKHRLDGEALAQRRSMGLAEKHNPDMTFDKLTVRKLAVPQSSTSFLTALCHNTARVNIGFTLYFLRIILAHSQSTTPQLL